MSEVRPLLGKRVLLARPAGQNEETAELLRAKGAEPRVIPCIVIGPPDDPAALVAALARARSFSWVVFTSANGVDRVWGALAEAGLSDATFGEARFAVVGKATAEALARRGQRATVTAKDAHGAGLAAALLEATQAEPEPPCVLLLRAEEASDAFPDAIRAAGHPVEIVAAYRTRPSEDGGRAVAEALRLGELDVVILSSGSIVDSIADALGPSAAERLAGVTVACLGPVTVAAARARGIRVDVVPEGSAGRVASFAAVIAALEERFRAI